VAPHQNLFVGQTVMSDIITPAVVILNVCIRSMQSTSRILQCGLSVTAQAGTIVMRAHIVAFVAYCQDGDRIVLTHTEVPEALAGQGIGSQLIRGVLDHLRATAVTVVPLCEFVAAYIERHPEYRDMLPDVS
jgi:predicted GNAT family acetyltransferase